MERPNFLSMLRQWFTEQKDCDVFFACPEDNTLMEKATIGAHKTILGMVSEVFEAMFYGSASKKFKQSEVIDIPDVNMSVFKLLLSFIYGSDIEFPNIEVACDFYYAADKYICKDAIEYVSNYLLKNVSRVNCIYLFEVASSLNDDKLKAASIGLFSGDSIFENEPFLKVQPDTVNQIFMREDLKITSEVVLINALERYVNYKDFDGKFDLLKIRPALQNIRFLTLTFKEIIGTSLLSDAEKFGILDALEPKGDLSKMPEGFSKNKKRLNIYNTYAEKYQKYHVGFVRIQKGRNYANEFGDDY